jgi:hypothetical protein
MSGRGWSPCRSPLVVHSGQCNTVRHRIYLCIHSPYLTLCGACGKSLIRVRRRARRGVCLRGAGGGGSGLICIRIAGQVYIPLPLYAALEEQIPPYSVYQFSDDREERARDERRRERDERRETRTGPPTDPHPTNPTRWDTPIWRRAQQGYTPPRLVPRGYTQRVVPEPQTHPTPSETRPGGTPLEAG